MKKRLIEVPFWGVPIPITVMSPRVELHYRLMSHLKTASLGPKDGLQMMVHESWCFPNAEQADVSCGIDAAVLKDFRSARDIAIQVLNPANISCIEDIRRLLRGGS